MILPIRSPKCPNGVISVEIADFVDVIGDVKRVFVIGDNCQIRVQNHDVSYLKIGKKLIYRCLGLWNWLITVLGFKWAVW